MPLGPRLYRRPLLVAFLFVLTGALGVVFLLYRHREPSNLLTVPVTRGAIETTVLASGTVESDNLVSVGAQVSGQLQSLRVALGDIVHAGQLVAEIDSLPQQNTLRTKTAALSAVRAQKQAKEASIALAELNYRRQRQMFQGDATSREDAETADANLKVLKAEIAALDAQIEQAKIAVDTAQLDLGYTKINSPINGVVVAIVTKQGQTVNANQSAPTIIKVARLDRMTIRVEISEADIIRVKPGQRVYFTILGEPDNRYPATVQSLEPAPESIAKETTTATTTSSSSTAVYYIGILAVPNLEGKLRIGMTAQVYIVLAEAQGVLTIPAAALGDRAPDGRYPVQVVSAAGQVEAHWVRVGLNDNVRAEISEGLQEGQQVLIGEMQAPSTVDAASSRRPRMPPPRMF